jgi:hypothetical protein
MKMLAIVAVLTLSTTIHANEPSYLEKYGITAKEARDSVLEHRKAQREQAHEYFLRRVVERIGLAYEGEKTRVEIEVETEEAQYLKEVMVTLKNKGYKAYYSVKYHTMTVDWKNPNAAR